MAKRNLTPAERDALERLRRLWQQKKGELHLTQEKVAHLCGWGTQGAFGHYLQGRMPLTIVAVLKLAKVLQVAPDELMPELRELLAVPSGERLSDSASQLLQAFETLPEQAQTGLRMLLESCAPAPPPTPPVSAEALRLAQAIEALSPKDRTTLQLLIDSLTAKQ